MRKHWSDSTAAMHRLGGGQTSSKCRAHADRSNSGIHSFPWYVPCFQMAVIVAVGTPLEGRGDQLHPAVAECMLLTQVSGPVAGEFALTSRLVSGKARNSVPANDMI